MSKDQLQKEEKLSRKQVADMLGVTPVTLWRYVNKGKFPAPKTAINGYSKYWIRADVEKFIKESSK